MRQVIAMRAIPGSGKSIFAKQLVAKAQAENKTAIICSADDFFIELGKGKYQFDPSKIADAHKYCFRKFIKAIQDEINLIIVDNTNLSAWELSPYKTYAEAQDYDFIINEVKASPDLAFKRQEHGVSLAAHQSMAESLEKEFIPPWWEKENIVSKTSETGEPIFEKEEINPKNAFSTNVNKILKLSGVFYKLAIKS